MNVLKIVKADLWSNVRLRKLNISCLKLFNGEGKQREKTYMPESVSQSVSHHVTFALPFKIFLASGLWPNPSHSDSRLVQSREWAVREAKTFLQPSIIGNKL